MGNGGFKLGHKHSDETKKKISLKNKGCKPNKGSFQKGQTPWNKDKRMPMDFRIKCSLRQRNEKEFTEFKSTELQRIKNSIKYREWRTKVFQRDEYTCQKCMKVGGYLEAHHIKPKRDFPELMFDINNGITYCRECHIIEDKIRGKGKTKNKSLGGD